MRRGWLSAVSFVLGLLLGGAAVAGSRRDWSGAAALGTTSAVIVALIPIWQGEGRRRQQARVLRVRLKEPLTLLGFLLSQELERVGGTPAAVRFDDSALERMRIFRSLLPKATHLDADEFERLMAVYDAMVVPFVTGALPGERAPVLLRLINEAATLLGRRAALPRETQVADRN